MARTYSVSVPVGATPERTWAVLADVTAWPSLTGSMTAVSLDSLSIGVGATARIKQPGMPAADWTVTRFVDGESFTWESRSPGVNVSADHVVTSDAAGNTFLTLSVSMSGLLAAPVWMLAAKRTRRFVDMEAHGIAQEAAQ